MKFGPWEIGLLLIIILIVFGVGKLPDIGRQFGKGIRDFKKFSSGAEDEDTKAAGVTPSKSQAELDVAKAKLEAAEAKLKLMEDPAKKNS
ncbi:MAG: twin-arginine translocase TatA/TatE family subunit [Dehalococcoidales bacterium]|nr:twin-arginine translocase TatA/TatE family subunit [Dehalococcoidales bacterium]